MPAHVIGGRFTPEKNTFPPGVTEFIALPNHRGRRQQRHVAGHHLSPPSHETLSRPWGARLVEKFDYEIGKLILNYQATDEIEANVTRGTTRLSCNFKFVYKLGKLGND